HRCRTSRIEGALLGGRGRAVPCGRRNAANPAGVLDKVAAKGHMWPGSHHFPFTFGCVSDVHSSIEPFVRRPILPEQPNSRGAFVSPRSCARFGSLPAACPARTMKDDK